MERSPLRRVAGPLQSKMDQVVAFHVSLVGRTDLSGEIYRQIRQAILDRRLRPGERLPPTRELATALRVSRSTVTVAYESLLAEGFATSHTGSGTFVSHHSRRNDRHREPGDRRPARSRCVEFGRRYRFHRRPFSAGRVSTSEPGLHRLQRSSKMSHQAYAEHRMVGGPRLRRQL